LPGILRRRKRSSQAFGHDVFLRDVYRDKIAFVMQQVLKIFLWDRLFAGAYLFGSVLDQCCPDSDIDVGILLVPVIAHAEAEKFWKNYTWNCPLFTSTRKI